ncbi:MAG: hypothetical protein ABIY71_10410, partial [Flavobacteriales bacterium]
MLATNADLYHYLLELSSKCRVLGLQHSADKLELAAKYVAGSPSEFLHEAQEALLLVADEAMPRLGADEHRRILNAIQEIDE